ncbi:hypothetical protein [Terasakiella sp.]|uniref:hypothetical protein n=1 Tax=Terasakiella sp. TaxID=2034861 RepID=UPI003AA7EA01
MKTRITYVNSETSHLEIHPLALPYAQAWQELKRHWSPRQLSATDLNNIQTFSIICAVKMRKKYYFFSDFEVVRILREQQTKTWALRVFENVSDDIIKQIAANFLTNIKIFNLDRNEGLASLQSAVASRMDAAICENYFGQPLFHVRPTANVLGLTHKELRNQHKKFAGEKR